MKLFYMPGACSLAAHIALREANLAFDLVEVDYQTRRTENGRDFRAINPKGSVPALLLDSGEVLTEVPVILQFAAGATGGKHLQPADGMARLRALEWLNFIATEIHKSCSPLFRPTTPDAFLEPAKAHLCSRLEIVEGHLCANNYLMGEEFSLADAYLFSVCCWLKGLERPIANWPALHRHFRRIVDRPCVQQALACERMTG